FLRPFEHNSLFSFVPRFLPWLKLPAICVFSIFTESKLYCFIFYSTVADSIFLAQFFVAGRRIKPDKFFYIYPVPLAVLQPGIIPRVFALIYLSRPGFNGAFCIWKVLRNFPCGHYRPQFP